MRSVRIALGGSVVFAVIGFLTVVIPEMMNPYRGHAPTDVIALIVAVFFGLVGLVMGAVVGRIFSQYSGGYQTAVFALCTVGGIIGGALGAVLAWLIGSVVLMPSGLVGALIVFILSLALCVVYRNPA